MAFDQRQNEGDHARAPPGCEVGACTRAEHKRSFARPAVDLRRFGVHRFERRLFEAKFRRTSGALAQPGAAADAVDSRRFSKPSCPARLILFR